MYLIFCKITKKKQNHKNLKNQKMILLKVIQLHSNYIIVPMKIQIQHKKKKDFKKLDLEKDSVFHRMIEKKQNFLKNQIKKLLIL